MCTEDQEHAVILRRDWEDPGMSGVIPVFHFYPDHGSAVNGVQQYDGRTQNFPREDYRFDICTDNAGQQVTKTVTDVRTTAIFDAWIGILRAI
ncbi:TPA: hypothetical protein DDW35_04505 [Candidatus Sumerlaeota bacterium]|jgi:hypothetical protein|nr:hypothetical protein [Candidatus Sumerlaeota bacterium]